MQTPKDKIVQIKNILTSNAGPADIVTGLGGRIKQTDASNLGPAKSRPMDMKPGSPSDKKFPPGS
jgi:hypothetical protein